MSSSPTSADSATLFAESVTALQVDVFNMTEALVMELPEEAATLTHDGVHWSEVVNLIKAQVLLNNVADAMPAAAHVTAARPQWRRLSGS